MLFTHDRLRTGRFLPMKEIVFMERSPFELAALAATELINYAPIINE